MRSDFRDLPYAARAALQQGERDATRAHCPDVPPIPAPAAVAEMAVRRDRPENVPADRSTPAARAVAERQIGERWLRVAASLRARNPDRAEHLAAVGYAHLEDAARELAAAPQRLPR